MLIKELKQELVSITSWAVVFHRKFEGDFLKTLSRLRSKFANLTYKERIYSGAFSELIIDGTLEYDERTQIKRSRSFGERQIQNFAFESVDAVGEEFKRLRSELLDELLVAGAAKIAEITKDIHKDRIAPTLPSPSTIRIPKVTFSDLHTDHLNSPIWEKELSDMAKEYATYMAKKREMELEQMIMTGALSSLTGKCGIGIADYIKGNTKKRDKKLLLLDSK